MDLELAGKRALVTGASRGIGLTIARELAREGARVVLLTKNLADELGPSGINVTVVHPGLTRTENTPAVIAARAAASGASLEEAERQIGARIAIGRIVDAQEVAYVVAFLA